MKKLLFGSLLVFMVTCLNAGELDFKEYGFVVEGFDESPQTDYNFLILQILKPKSTVSGRNTSLNVIIQHHEGTMQEYIEISNNMYKKINDFKIIKEHSDEKTAYWEYTASFDGPIIHVISKALIDEAKGKVFLVSAACSPADWESDEKEIRRAIESFRIYKK